MNALNRNVHAGDVTLATQSFGTASNPAVVLVMGATASMLGWPDELCLGLAEQGQFVVRYDHRDTGRSTTYPPGAPPYAVEDLVADLLAVMDAYGIEHAHLVGMSLGGLMAQIAALTTPDRVTGLTLIGSEPLGWDGEMLPHIAPVFLEHFATLANLDWSNPQSVRGFLMNAQRLCAGSGEPFDAERANARVDAVMSHSPNLASAHNHGLVQLRDDWTGRYRQITKPTLVIHGEDDPILPLENGEALASAIPGARLLVLPGVGHELPVRVLHTLIEEISAHV